MTIARTTSTARTINAIFHGSRVFVFAPDRAILRTEKKNKIFVGSTAKSNLFFLRVFFLNRQRTLKFLYCTILNVPLVTFYKQPVLRGLTAQKTKSLH